MGARTAHGGPHRDGGAGTASVRADGFQCAVTASWWHWFSGRADDSENTASILGSGVTEFRSDIGAEHRPAASDGKRTGSIGSSKCVYESVRRRRSSGRGINAECWQLQPFLEAVVNRRYRRPPFLTETRASIQDGYLKVVNCATETNGKKGTSISSIVVLGNGFFHEKIEICQGAVSHSRIEAGRVRTLMVPIYSNLTRRILRWR